MEKEIKREAGKQYVRYFRLWFIFLGILAVVFIGAFAIKALKPEKVRTNKEAPEERVYDMADVLTDAEEQKLREHIAEQEKLYHFDIVLVTINEDVESHGNYTTVMTNWADDFYDELKYGYNKSFEGDGVLLLDNWYEDKRGSQKGNCLSTSGSVYKKFGNDEINRVQDAVDRYVDTDPYRAYKAYVDETCRLMSRGLSSIRIPIIAILLLPIVAAGSYLTSNMYQTPAADTTAATAYVPGGRPDMRVKNDDFIRKNVVTTRIQSSSSGGGGSSGYGGSHRSSSGARHGGGVRRR
ncbi:MAG: TPM domain-containing protein [Bacteroidales bacterium]|nr:TPM domain-containing protein [Lachnoclostridium sp.]MCM1384070.1 TPM domain-containing protein [Lachnoclostridium sp.]MCM1465461.1 TPM domain-containing protein [Bacteroidales bacterium]